MVSDRSLSMLGWAFDLFTVSISVTDVVADVLVAVQFLQEGHTLWAWLVLGFFFNSTVVYALILTGTMMSASNSEFQVNGDHIFPGWVVRGSKVKKFVLVLPFAQLAPSGMYVLQTFVMPWLRRRAAGPVSSTSGGLLPAVNVEYGTSAAAVPALRGTEGDAFAAVDRGEAAEVADTFLMMGRLRAALEKQVVTHGMLLAETLVESVPQSIVQLLAMTFLGTPSVVQSVSLTLSLLSVVTKAYFVSLSCDFKMFVFKFAAVAFDVMSMFYIFATVLSSARSSDVALLGDGSLRVSYLAYVWVVKLIVQVGFTLFLFLLLMLFVLIDFWIRVAMGRASCNLPKWRDLRMVIGLFLLGCMLFLPAVMLLEAAKVSWILVLMFRVEPELNVVPVASIVYAFLERAGGSKEEHRRLIHLLKQEVHPSRSYNTGPTRATMLVTFQYHYMDLVDELYQIAHSARSECESFEETLRASLNVSQRGHSYYGLCDVRKSSLDLSPLADDVLLSSAHPFGYQHRNPLTEAWHYFYYPETRDQQLFAWLLTLAEPLKPKCKIHKTLHTFDAALVYLAGSMFEKETERTVQWYRTVRDAARDGRDEHGNLLPYSGTQYVARRLEEYLFAPKRLYPMLWDCADTKFPRWRSAQQADGSGGGESLLIALFVVWFAVDALCILVSLAFPFVSVALDYRSQNLLQWLCFGTSCALLAVMLATGLWVPAYLRRVPLVTAVLSWARIESPEVAQGKVVKYFRTTPANTVVHAACRAAESVVRTRPLLTPEMMFTVASFLRPADIVTKDLTTQECQAMKASEETLLDAQP